MHKKTLIGKTFDHCRPIDPYHVKMGIKSLDQQGHFAGYASVFNIVDNQRDIVMRGAFAGSIKGRASDIKLLWQHQPDEPIGIFNRIFEDARGLYVEGRLLLNVRRAKEAHALLKAGAISGLSIGYTPAVYRIDKKTGVRIITQIDLWEISLVTFPANEAAGVTVIKGLAEQRSFNKRSVFNDYLQAHAAELHSALESYAFTQDTRGEYMTLAEKLDRSRQISSLFKKSQLLLNIKKAHAKRPGFIPKRSASHNSSATESYSEFQAPA